MPSARPIRILCVDDNPEIIEAIRLRLASQPGYAWAGSLASADRLLEVARVRRPDIILLDVDMPGRDPFETVLELAVHDSELRVIMLSGHVRRDLINRAIGAGAWGYVAKCDGERAVLQAIEQVAAGEFVMSAEARSGYAL
jgi:DNA-binding NarL/FixJ family response regulator